MPLMAYKRPESVLVIVYHQEKILLLQRRDDPAFWQSVTGSLLVEEAPLTAAWRELKEETGFTSEQGKMQDCQAKEWFDIYPQWQYRYAPGTTRNLEHVFCFELRSFEPICLSDEHLNYIWVSKKVALDSVLSETNRKAILKYI